MLSGSGLTETFAGNSTRNSAMRSQLDTVVRATDNVGCINADHIGCTIDFGDTTGHGSLILADHIAGADNCSFTSLIPTVELLTLVLDASPEQQALLVSALLAQTDCLLEALRPL